MCKLKLKSRVEELERRLQMIDDRLSHVHDMALCSAAAQEGERHDGQEQQEPEQPRPLLTGPCIAKTRGGDVVPVQRWVFGSSLFVYAKNGFGWTITKHGTYKPQRSLNDIAEVVRMLTNQEVLDWQFRGIEPEL